MNSIWDKYKLKSFEIIVFFIRKWSIFNFLPFVGEFIDLVLIHLDFNWLKSQSFDQVQIGISGKGSQDPEKRLFVLVVWFGWDVEVLKVSLSVESDLSGLNFSVFLINLVADQDDRDVIADSGQVFVPLGNIFVGDSGRDIEHKNGCVGANVITFSEPAELFLSSSVPQWELDGAMIGIESDWADLNTLGGDVFLFELSSNVSFDECGLANTTISDENDLEFSYYLGSLW